MARGQGNKRGPRQAPVFQQSRLPQPQTMQQFQPTPRPQQFPQSQRPQQFQQAQQFPQPIMITHMQQTTPALVPQPSQTQYSQPQIGPWQGNMMTHSPQQIVVHQVQVPVRMQQSQPQRMQHCGLQGSPTAQQQRFQQQQQHQRLQHQNPHPHMHQQQQQQQQLHQQQQQLIQQQPQMVQIGNKKRAQESNSILTEQNLREPFVSTLERNMNKYFFSHTLHRTFGPALAQINQ